MVSLAATALTVLATQEDVLHDGATEQEQYQVTEYDSMARVESRSVFVAVDVGRDDAIQVSPANDETQGDTALVDTCKTKSDRVHSAVLGRLTLNIVAGPRDCVRYCRVDSHRAQKDACISRTGGLTPQQHGETNDAEERHGDVADPTLAGAVCNKANCHRQNCRGSVGRYAEQLTLDRAVACEVSVQHVSSRSLFVNTLASSVSLFITYFCGNNSLVP